MKIDVIAEFTPYTAIGKLAEHVVLALQAKGHKVGAVGKMVDGQWGSRVHQDVLACAVKGLNLTALPIWVGPLVKAAEAPTGSIVVTGWESDTVPSNLAHPLRRAAAVLTWGRWTAATLQKARLHVPVHAFQLGVDLDVFCPLPQVRPRRTTFLAAGRTTHGRFRKGVDLVMLAFLYAFPSDREEVVLQVKIQPDCPLTHLRSGRIQAIAEWLGDEQMASWYRQGSAFVCASQGEGWGWHAHEALACGVPLIAPHFGGLTEFFQPDHNGWKVPYKLVPATQLHEKAGKWAQPDFYALAERMRYVHENPAEAAVFGTVGMHSVAKLDIANMHKQLVAAIERYGR